MLLPLSIAVRLLSCLQVQVRRRSGRARVEEQAFRLTAPGLVEMLTAEQAAALQQQADAQQAAGDPGRRFMSLHSMFCLVLVLVTGAGAVVVQFFLADLLTAQLSWLLKTPLHLPNGQQSGDEVHLAGVQIRRLCHLQTRLHRPP